VFKCLRNGTERNVITIFINISNGTILLWIRIFRSIDLMFIIFGPYCVVFCSAIAAWPIGDQNVLANVWSCTS
ncbi:hypothetical protein BLOT_004010, partial [Blomia tropicalis]